MKLILSLILFGAVAAATAPEGTGDNINLDEIFANDRLYSKYYNCIMDKGKCTADGQKIKVRLADSIKDNCKTCTDIQKKNVEKTVKYMLASKKDDFAKFEKKYDPEGKLRKKFGA